MEYYKIEVIIYTRSTRKYAYILNIDFCQSV